MAIGISLDANRDGVPTRVEVEIEGDRLVLSLASIQRKGETRIDLSLRELGAAIKFHRATRDRLYVEPYVEPGFGDETPTEPLPSSDSLQIDGVPIADDFVPPSAREAGDLPPDP